MVNPVKRACDPCHRRKVKCDGTSQGPRCNNCNTAGLSCTYNAVPQKKGPKGSRAKVISELRETQRITSLMARIQSRSFPGGAAPPPPDPALAAANGPSPGLVTNEIVKPCLDYFFDNVYPNMPIFDRESLDGQGVFMEQNRDVYCLVTALCAFVMIQPGMTVPANPDVQDFHPLGVNTSIIAKTILVEEVLRVRAGYEYLEAPTFNSVATSYLLYACCVGEEMHNRAWYYLREASTLLHMLDMHKEETYQNWEPAEAARRRRLYWLVATSERSYALKHKRPLTLPSTVNLPTPTDDPSDPNQSALLPFTALAAAFRYVEEPLVSTWVQADEPLSTNQAYPRDLEATLAGEYQRYLCEDPQFADLDGCQRWIKDSLWGLRGEDDVHGQGQYSLEVKEMFKSWGAHFPGQGAQIVQTTVMEKLLETWHAAIGALSHKPASRTPFNEGPRERLTRLLEITATIRAGQHRFAPLLVHKLLRALSSLANPMLYNSPDLPLDMGLDMFDGFGTAGIAHVPQAMFGFDDGMPMGGFVGGDDAFERKYQIPVQPSVGASPESNGCDASPGGAGSGLAPHTSPENFATSPPVLSPGSEFPGLSDSLGFGDMMMPHGSVGMGGHGHQQQCMPMHAQGQGSGPGLNAQQLRGFAGPMVHGPQGIPHQGMPPGPGQVFNYTPRQAELLAQRTQMPVHRIPPQANGMAGQMPLPTGFAGGHSAHPGHPTMTVRAFHELQQGFRQVHNHG